MAETAVIIGYGVMAASAAGGAVMSVQAARNSQKAASIQAGQYEDQKRLAALQSAQQEADRREGLNRILGAQAALRGARGLDPYGEAGSSGGAIRDDAILQAERDLRTGAINEDYQARRFDLAASSAIAQGDAQAAQYYGQAAKQVGSAFSAGMSGYDKLMSGANTPADTPTTPWSQRGPGGRVAGPV